MTAQQTIKVAILDDYQNVALTSADWSTLDGVAEITVFGDTISDPDQIVRRLAPFDVVCIMRERTALPRRVVAKLPNLKLICSTGPANQAIDLEAAKDQGIVVRHTGYFSTPTIELTWALILALARNIPQEVRSLQQGRWQSSVGDELAGKTLGLLGLGRVGSAVASIGRAFGMDVIAWSQNLTPELAREKHVRWVPKDELFALSDYLSIHVRLSSRTECLVDHDQLALMKPSARLINTSRARIVSETALEAALRNRTIAGAALDVFETEPIGAPMGLAALANVIATPHIGYVSNELYRPFYGDSVRNILDWLAEQGR